MSEWYVSSQVIGGRKMYIATRMLDDNQPEHGGNVERAGEYSGDKESVELLVTKLNEGEVAE